ncbi:hypothetical protein F7725_011303 [Dissostichus mawsoni]|uniref:UBC core domain-containing protein n=1 Tax=Dissostichus mawsoni TaxID=36200 RepID=A0A7J5Z8G0_DISMA|nr:hypothetical protein F7725_011303 [Dissostichus mawsoni]
MREILEAVYGLLISPEPEDPLDSILAEEFLTSRETYQREAEKHTEETAGKSLDDMEKNLVEPVPQFIPQHLICPLTKKMFVDPVKTAYGTVYERKAIEEHLKKYMDAILDTLKQFRLESYCNQLLQLGVKDSRDFLDSVTDEDLDNMAPEQQVQTVTPVHKSLKSFCLQYTYPKCATKTNNRCGHSENIGNFDLTDMDPAKNTVEDLMLRICHLESVGNSKGVCLYTIDGMPLTDDPFFNTWFLKDRHIENGAVIYAIFTPRENLKQFPQTPKREVVETLGSDIVRCHIMLKGDFQVTVKLASDTISSLRLKLANKSGIPEHVLHYKGPHGGDDTLESCGISEGSTVNFSLSSFPHETSYNETFFINDFLPSVPQTQKGISVFLSSLYAVIAVVEGLYLLFREILPQRGRPQAERLIKDLDVFENSLYCWAHLLSEAKKPAENHENYAPITLTSEDGSRFSEPVRVPGVPGALEWAYVCQKIQDGEKIPNCTEEVLRGTSIKKATDIEKVLLSLPPFVRTYPLWIHKDKTAGQNFKINNEKTFGSMMEELKSPNNQCLNVTPPLRLKELGICEARLVLLSEDNIGVCLRKEKCSPDMIVVLDCFDGKNKTVDVNLLAARTGDHGDGRTFVTTRTPKEAILVLIDTSSSMEEECYASAEIQKINAVKELFDNFATRTMAYDFCHIIGLVKFDSLVKILHTFTENLETFKEHMRNIEASGCTLLYDALRRGASELEEVKTRFPDCRLRIISCIEPDAVTAKLLKSNIVVDSILLGNVENNMLHGISNATGGCCFKPKTTKDGLKLFEIETVLSLEQRKLKETHDPSSISKRSLTRIFATHGYDECPETSLPSQINSKVTATDSALKKKIKESTNGRFLEKDKRVLEELKSLHCNPHPFFRVFPSESDFRFSCRALLTHRIRNVFELYCQFGPDYPAKPPLVRFVTPVYHCNVNSVGRICHNLFDRNYNAHITMREILEAVYGLLISPEPEDPLDSILAEEFLTSLETYEREAEKHTEETAGKSLDDMEKNLVEPVPQFIPQHLICPLTKKMFVDPVKTVYGTVYECKAIEEHLKQHQYDPTAGPGTELKMKDIRADQDMKKMVMDHRTRQINV